MASEVLVVAVAVVTSKETLVSAVATETESSAVALVAQVQAVLSAVVAVVADAGDRQSVEDDSVAVAAARVAWVDSEEVMDLAEMLASEAVV